MSIVSIILSLLVFIVGMMGLYVLQKKGVSYSIRVYVGLGAGIVFGIILQVLFTAGSDELKTIIDWINIVGSGYIAFLQVLIIPLIMVSLIRAFTRITGGTNLKKISSVVLITLLLTTAIAAFIAIMSTLIFDLPGAGFTQGSADTAKIAELQTKQTKAVSMTLPQQVISFLPRNIFADMSASRPTSTIAVVIFSVVVGIAFLGVKKYNEKDANFFANIVDSFYSIIDYLVGMVLMVAPFGIFALITKMMATNSFEIIKKLSLFVIAIYVAIIAQFIVHTIILAVAKVNPLKYYKKVFPVLSFAFSSRTSAGAVPMNIETQIKKLGVDETCANFSATFGLSIGQNGCAGIYPAMLAAIVAPTIGMDITKPINILIIVGVVVLSSFGVAGVGGGGTFASLIVFGTLGLPIEIIGLLVSIEPLVDMGRTALNVNDSMIAGVLAAKSINRLDKNVFDAD